jgi:PAS domain S-box-containing protein
MGSIFVCYHRNRLGGRLEHSEEMQPVNILVVDDDQRHASSVGALLEKGDRNIETVSDPQAGLTRMQNGVFDIVILDINMPGLSGIELLRRGQPASRGIKAIVVSGEKDISVVAPILHLGAYDYLTKPYAPEQLLSSVRNAEAQVQLERSTRRIQAQREAANRRHEFLINSSPDLIFMLDHDGRFTFVNNKLKHIFRYDDKTLIGRHWTALVEPPLQEILRHRMDERRTGDRATRHLEFDYHDHQGKLHVIELSSMGLYETVADELVFVGTYGVIRDVTEPRKTARVLAQSQQKFYGLFMNSPDVVFISRLDDGVLIEANDNFATMMTDLGDGDLSTDLPLWGSAEARESFVAGLYRSPRRHQVVLDREIDGQTRYFEITARKLYLDRADCMMASLKDLTAQRQAESDRLHLEAQVQQASKMEAIGQLAGGIAHDFNNILASIIGYTELALVSLPREQQSVASYLKEVVGAGQRARDLISQMLTFTRAHRGRAELTAVHANIAEVSRMLRAAIPRTIDIVTELSEDLPQVMIDPVQLQQIVINLLINARDAMDGKGRITVSAECGHFTGGCVSCAGRFEGDYLVLTVGDTGRGVPSSMHRKIFDMFVSTREAGRGTGIGLWLIHTIVHEYDGHIRLESTPSGSRFHILLPVSVPIEAEEPAPAPTFAGHSAVEGHGHVVVIDDELSVANFVAEVLRNAGYDVLVFNDSPAARTYVKSHAPHIGLVLTDQAMPQVTGLDIAATAQAIEPPVPVVILTGFADRADSSRLSQLGVAQLLEKPFRIDVLLRAVHAHIRTPMAAPALKGTHTAT